MKKEDRVKLSEKADNGIRSPLVRTERETVAAKAHKKLRHIVVEGKLNDISSREKSTPPIGDPKATATPAALAAVRSSRIRAIRSKRWKGQSYGQSWICRILRMEKGERGTSSIRHN